MFYSTSGIILFGSSMESGRLLTFALVVFPAYFLGRCVLEDLMDSTDHDTGDDWNRPFQFELFQGRLNI